MLLLVLAHSGSAGQRDIKMIVVLFGLFGSRPSDHYFRSVCLSVSLCRVFLSRL